MTETESAQESAGLPEEDVLKVLLATDIHLGYEEKDPIRGKSLWACNSHFYRFC